jgi:hypothetical protein
LGVGIHHEHAAPDPGEGFSQVHGLVDLPTPPEHVNLDWTVLSI